MHGSLNLEALKGFLQASRHTKITITKIHWTGCSHYANNAQCILIKKLRILGIWDQREQDLGDEFDRHGEFDDRNDSSDWRVQTHGTEKDPDEYLVSLRDIFAQQSD
jgi:hypothetical protein